MRIPGGARNDSEEIKKEEILYNLSRNCLNSTWPLENRPIFGIGGDRKMAALSMTEKSWPH